MKGAQKALLVSLASFGIAFTTAEASISLPHLKAEYISPSVQHHTVNTAAEKLDHKDNLAKKTRAKEPKQMWNLQNADIRAVIQTISELTGKSFIVDPQVQGKITLISSKPLTNKELYQVFLSMLQVLNYVAIPSGRVIKIVPSVEAKEYAGALLGSAHHATGDQVVVRVIQVNNLSADQLVNVIRPLMQSWASVSAYPASNSLILAGAAANVNHLVQIIHKLDTNSATGVKIVHLKYASADKLVTVLNALNAAAQAKGGAVNVSIAADKQNNSILISGDKVERNKMTRLIKQLDRGNASGTTNTVVVKLNYLTAKKLAPILIKVAKGQLAQEKTTENKDGKTHTTSSSFGVAAGTTGEDKIHMSIVAEDDDNAIIMNGPTGMIRSLRKIITALDKRPQEVLVEAMIVKVNESVAKNLGIQWGSAPPAEAGAAAANPGEAEFTSGFNEGVGFLNEGRFQAVVHLLSTSTSADVLSTPSVVVLNNKKASLSDGTNVGLESGNTPINGPTGSTDGSGSGSPSAGNGIYNTFNRTNIGLSLSVQPQIAPDNTIRLVIDESDGSLTDPNSTSPNQSYLKSEIKTSVLVNSGNIIVLGGLISNDSENTEHKIPILGDIPILGHLFRYKEPSVTKNNLMIFLKPIVLNNARQATRETRSSYNFVRYQQMRNRAGFSFTPQDKFPVLPVMGSRPKPMGGAVLPAPPLDSNTPPPATHSMYYTYKGVGKYSGGTDAPPKGLPMPADTRKKGIESK